MTAASPRRELGNRIATHRRARKLTQLDLANAAFLSLATIKAIERGARSPSDSSLDSIADALGTDPSRLTHDSQPATIRVRAAIPAISAAIAGYDIPAPGDTPPPHQLRAAVAEAVTWRLGSQYTRIAEAGPDLLAACLHQLHTPTGMTRPAAAALLVDAARAVDAVAYKFGERDLSARLVELMRWAAAQTDDPAVIAAAAYVRTEVFFAARAHDIGLLALETAIDACPTPATDRGRASVGALHMRAAVIAARASNSDAATLHLDRARDLADGVKETVYVGTAFGPDSVRIHEVSTAVSLGHDHVQRALDVASEWTPPASLPAERQSGFWIELARAELWAGRRDNAFESLKVARKLAPQHTRQHPWARDTVATLRRLRRADDESLTGFADWIGAV